jgi:putative addiction module CopG family antidote
LILQSAPEATFRAYLMAGNIAFDLPEDLQRFVQAKVQSGQFTSSDEAITEAARLLRQRVEAEEARALEGIARSLEDAHAGRAEPLAEAFAYIRARARLAGRLALPEPVNVT